MARRPLLRRLRVRTMETPPPLPEVASRRRDRLRWLRRAAVAVTGGLLLLGGVLLLFLPGPGLVVIVLALALLATEFAWARRPLDAARARLEQARDAIRRKV